MTINSRYKWLCDNKYQDSIIADLLVCLNALINVDKDNTKTYFYLSTLEFNDVFNGLKYKGAGC